MIEGGSVFLTTLLPGDARVLFEWANDPVLARSHGPFRPVDETAHQAWFEVVGQDQGKVVFAIRDKEDGRPVGWLQIANIQPVFRSAEMSLLIADLAERQKGKGGDALEQGLRFCWRELNLERVTSFIFGDNPAARALLTKFGFQDEACLRRAAFIGGRWHDITILAAFHE